MMVSKIDDIINNMEKKERTIRYLKNIYKIEVGAEPIIPDNYIDDFMRLETINTQENEEEPIQFGNFKDKITSLKLPDANDKEIKAKLAKMRKEKHPSLITELNLSNYGDKGFNQEQFKKLLDGLKVLKSVESLNLRKNKIDDSYIDNLVELFNIDNLKRIDISFNNLHKNSVKKLYNGLKGAKNLEYFDCSFNPFCTDEFSCSQIASSLKGQTNLYHLGLSDSTKDAVIRAINYFPNIRSLNLDDCKYKGKSFETILKILTDKKYNIAELSLRFVLIDTLNSSIFEKIIRQNKTLVHLNLYGCKLSDYAGAKIISGLNQNKNLVTLNLGLNNLSDDFCIEFGKKIILNNVLSTVFLNRNYNITNKNFIYILEGLVNNSTILSLGDLSESKLGVKHRESAELILAMNKKILYNDVVLEISKKEKENYLRLSYNASQIETANSNGKIQKISNEKTVDTKVKTEVKPIITDSKIPQQSTNDQNTFKIESNDPNNPINLIKKVKQVLPEEEKAKPLIEKKLETIEEQMARVIKKYDIKLYQDEIEDFQYFNTYLLI